MKRTKVSMRDIARECKVSIATVSRVLNNQKGVGERVKKKISEIIKKSNYDPYRNIPLLKKIRQRSIKVVTPYYSELFLSNPFFTKGLSGVKKIAHEKQYELVLTTEESVLNKQREMAEGVNPISTISGVVLLCPIRDWEEEIGRLQEWDLPVALVNRKTEKKNVISVHEKREQGIGSAIDHFLSLGYKNIIGIARKDQYLHTYNCIRKVFRERNLPDDERHLFPIIDVESSNELDIIDSFHKDERMPDAMLISDDERAIKSMKHLQRLGYRIPEDVAVIGHDNVEIATYFNPELTSVDCPVDRMAALATKMLIEQMESGDYHGMDVELDNELIIRDSCGYKLKNG